MKQHSQRLLLKYLWVDVSFTSFMTGLSLWYLWDWLIVEIWLDVPAVLCPMSGWMFSITDNKLLKTSTAVWNVYTLKMRAPSLLWQKSQILCAGIKHIRSVLLSFCPKHSVSCLLMNSRYLNQINCSLVAVVRTVSKVAFTELLLCSV